ncbi:MAG TPA: AMP-binding protein [Thermoanaerobaculia bacterium]
MAARSFATVVRAFDDSLAKHPDRTAIHVLERPAGTFALSYADLHRAGRRAANGFRARHLGAGDRVIVAIPTSRDFFAVYFGALFSGVIPIMVPAPRASRPMDSHAAQLDVIAGATGATSVVATAEAGQQLSTLSPLTIVTPEELCGDGEIASLDFTAKDTDVAHLQATSGTTGTPKFAVIRHRNITANVEGIGLAIRHRDGDSLVTWLPLFHDMGLIGISYALFWQCPLIATDAANFVHNPITWLQMISRFRGTLSPAPNSAYQACARLAKRRTFEDLDLSSWRVALCGAEPVHEETIRQFSEAFAGYGFPATTMLPVYGLAEATLAATIPDVDALPHVERVDAELMESAGRCLPAPDAKRGASLVSVGPAIPGHRIRITDSQGLPLREREIGEVEFAGPSVIDGYWSDPRDSEALKRADGFLRTGDLGYLAEGQLYVTGRQKDIIIINGRNLVPAQIEAAMESVIDSDVAHGLVACGMQDASSKTESLHLLVESRVVPHPDQAAAEDKLRSALESAFGIGGVRIHWVKRGEIPKTSSGKIQRHRCRELIRQLGAGALPAVQATPQHQQRSTSWIPPTT